MEKNRHTKPTSLKDILRYLTRAGSHRERNLMERKMEQDAFLDDAVEGLSGADMNRARHDVSDINRRIKGRSKEIPVWFRMGIAASLALLVMAGLGYLYLEMSGREGMRDQLAVEQRQDSVIEDLQPEIIEAEQDVLKEEAPLMASPEEMAPMPSPVPAPIADAPEEMPLIIAEVEEDYFADTEMQETMAAPRSEANYRMEAAGAARSLATGVYPDTTGDIIVGAQPVTGFELYYIYIEESALLADAAELSAGLVKLSFEINREGQPVNFEIMETPDPELAKKAISIVENGARWIPATKNDVFFIQRVELDIKFRK